ncbi:hypothetical protein CYMTET_47084 [Cymbomonas tetramitiformis]|uniref:Uncharacterized protein n=1 Tax=Cymbomonas tetramitiformis TaxID=36881 RepID=A0AAE0BUZ0_9CHLO|nr:hypothetical protein CYMTET_47084 [Cymbomonas tetramitiformis]
MSVSASGPALLTITEVTGRRVKTPGDVFGAQNKGKTFEGRVKCPDERPDCVTVRYDDGDEYWFPLRTVMRWLAPPRDDGNESDESADLQDEPDEGEFADPSSTLELPGARSSTSSQQESLEDRATRLESEKFQKSTAQNIGALLEENRRSAATQASFESKANSKLYTQPPDDYTPGMLKRFAKDKPKDVEKGMWEGKAKALEGSAGLGSFYDAVSLNPITDVLERKVESRRPIQLRPPTQVAYFKILRSCP